MPRFAVVPTVLAALLMGCATDVDGVELLAPEQVRFSWDDAYNEPNDGLMALLPLDVMVYDARTGDPLLGADVTLTSADARFVRADDVWSGDALCDTCMWDAHRDEFVDVSEGALDAPMVVTTDETGLARVYVLVDNVPSTDDGFSNVAVRATFAGQRRLIDLLPQ